MDRSRILVLLGLVLLFVGSFYISDRFDLFSTWGPFGDALPWIIFGLIVWRFGGCCGSRSCMPKAKAS